jgi:hypothetical protein
LYERLDAAIPRTPRIKPPRHPAAFQSPSQLPALS